LGGAEQRGDVHVVPAGVHHRDVVAVAVGGPGGAGVVQAGGLLDRQGVHVGTQQDACAGPVAQHADHPRAADAVMHLVAALTQPVGDRASRLELLVREFRKLVQPAVEVLLPRPHAGLAVQDIADDL
jgi:hypothetical protein